jgi:peptidyl-prolyl cis-trans isomerase B (cyclophilin B)
LYTPVYKPNGDEVAVIKTTKGTIKVKLFGKEAPIHVGNFVELARKGFYDKIKFHRYIAGFVVQGGDPQTREMTSEEVVKLAADPYGGLGTGGPGYTIKGEFDPSVNPHKHSKGALAMARSTSPDSAGSQFYFALEPQPRLDGSYTVFGEVTQGLEVMEQLRIGDEIESVTIENAAQ